jgi:hypothetical protein
VHVKILKDMIKMEETRYEIKYHDWTMNKVLEVLKEVIEKTNTRMKLVFHEPFSYEIASTGKKFISLVFSKNYDKWDQIDFEFYQTEINTMINELEKSFDKKVRLGKIEINDHMKKIYVYININDIKPTDIKSTVIGGE